MIAFIFMHAYNTFIPLHTSTQERGPQCGDGYCTDDGQAAIITVGRGLKHGKSHTAADVPVMLRVVVCPYSHVLLMLILLPWQQQKR